MSTSNRIGRNPFEKANKVLKTSNKKAKEAPAVQIQEEQIIGELIELPDESWQPLTAAPAGFIKQLFARWL